MKKILTIAAILGLSSAAFAFDLGGIKGTWQDEKWNANWTFSADGKIVLSDSKTGETYYTFTDSNTQDFKVNVGLDGVTLTFSSKKTARSYKFTKPASLDTDLDMRIEPTWTDAYETKIKFQN